MGGSHPIVAGHTDYSQLHGLLMRRVWLGYHALKRMSANQQRGHWWNRVLKGPRRPVTTHRAGSRAGDLLVPSVLITLAAITVVLVAVAAGVALGVVPFK